MVTRTKLFLAVTVLALVAAISQPQRALAMQHPPAGAGAAQPEPKERDEERLKPGEKSDANQIRNAPPVQALGRMLGLSNEKAYWLSILLNFAVLAGLVLFLLRKNLPGIFKARKDSIQDRIEQARKTSEEARERLKGVESRLSRLDTEIAEMRREAEENARNEEKRVLAEAEAERQRIVTAAEQEIAAVAGNARRELKAYAAELAVDLAGKKIRVGKDADQSLVREFTTQLGKDGN